MKKVPFSEHVTAPSPLAGLIRDVHAYFAGTAPKGVRLSDELLRDRRDEAAREKGD